MGIRESVWPRIPTECYALRALSDSRVRAVISTQTPITAADAASRISCARCEADAPTTISAMITMAKRAIPLVRDSREGP